MHSFSRDTIRVISHLTHNKISLVTRNGRNMLMKYLGRIQMELLNEGIHFHVFASLLNVPHGIFPHFEWQKWDMEIFRWTRDDKEVTILEHSIYRCWFDYFRCFNVDSIENFLGLDWYNFKTQFLKDFLNANLPNEYFSIRTLNKLLLFFKDVR